MVELTSESLLASNYNSTHPTVIMSHGDDDDLDYYNYDDADYTDNSNT